ncbi:MAG TPA: ATP-binding cassette domain-containing protein, partial [Candidatus Micrarchaeaceae archaeon]|nr:ATP-binding cassette domain-containing protein [Candidatus Micrarchaeaceae archaeon]
MADARPLIRRPMQAGRPELRPVNGAAPAKFRVDKLSFLYGKNKALNDVTFEIPEKRITAIIGPSGCGKSTLLRVFNRMYDLVPGARALGSVLLDGEDVVTTRNLLALRQKVGMVFQRPSPFP